MRTVRRLYFYAVAAISIEVVLWGLINLLRSIADQTVGGGVDALAQAIALVVVGVPIFLFHWLWAQRNAAKDEEEKTSTVRALYLYGVLLGTLVPLVQNLLALLDRTFLDALHLGADNALVGGSQSWPDNLIAIGMNALVAAYFFNILRNEWKTLPRVENFADIRRLFRFIWLYYSLVMMVLGAQQILSFMLSVPPDVLGDSGRAQLINGIALMVVGTPTWFYSWSLIQRSLADAAETDSNLRLGVLYLLALGSVITVLSMAVALLGIFISQLLGLQLTYPDLVHQIAGPVSIGLPLGVVWAYYGKVLNEHFASTPDPVRRSGMQRVQFYILSALGLGGAFLGVAALIKFMIDLLTGGTLILTDALRSNLAGTIALILAWLPLWLVSWRPMQREALGTDELGLHARRSVVRKAYLYLALFAGVIGGMGSAVALVFSLLRALLTGQTDSTFLATNLTDLELLILFVVLLAYHLRVLRRDARRRVQCDRDEWQQRSPGSRLDQGDGYSAYRHPR